MDQATRARRPGKEGAACRVVVMGVSGTGKSSVGRRVADVLGGSFIEGDDHHSPANVAKMAAGIPLTDGDRLPWLRRLGGLLARTGAEAGDGPAVLACSSLRRAYRDVLRDAVPGGEVFFVHLDAPFGVLEQRTTRRTGHFMPASLLRSQVQTLEPLEPDEHGVVVDVDAPLPEVVRRAVSAVREACAGTAGDR